MIDKIIQVVLEFFGKEKPEPLTEENNESLEALERIEALDNIGENTGILKKQLKEAGFKYVTIPPTVIKKHATGKGNANKELMYETFLSESHVDLKSQLSPKSTKISNPVSDIVDSFYICKTGFHLKEQLCEPSKTLI